MRSPRNARAAEPPFWLARLRWRLRGRSAWPALVGAIAVGGVLLAVLPPRGDPGVGVGEILQLAAALLLLGWVGSVVGARLLRRRDPSLPRIVARDRAATLALGAGVLALAVGGILHRPAVVADRQRLDAMIAEARGLAERRAPAYARQRLDEEDVRRLSTDVLRICFPVGRADRAWCAVVRRDDGTPRARTDSDPRSNAALAAEAEDAS